MSFGTNGTSAFNADVRTNDEHETAQSHREDRADALDVAAGEVEKRYDAEPSGTVLKKALKAALAQAKAEAKQARAEAREGSV